VRIAALAAGGGLAYWLDDVAPASAAYVERLALAESTGDARLQAEAHYDLGFMSMVGQREAELREHEQRALDLYLSVGDEDGAIRARQALVLATFLSGDYATARSLEDANLELFRSRGAELQVADSLMLLSAVNWRLGDLPAGWDHLQESLRLFAARDSASGLARVLGMAAIILLSTGDDERGARLAGATYRLVREKGVMLAPVRVLHLPDPATLANERLGEGEAAARMAEGEAMPLEDVVALVLATPVPGS
jgi:hypothetical protein